MKNNDVITITIKGENAKKFFLQEITKDFGIRFKKIPKESLILEETGSSKMAVEIFENALEKNFIKEVEFHIETAETNEEEIAEEIEEFEDSPISTEPNRKGLGSDQKEILSFLEKHPGEEFSRIDISTATNIRESVLKNTLPSLIRRNLIKRKRTRQGYVYFGIADIKPEEESLNTKNAIAKQSLSGKIQRILELFATPKYYKILNKILKNDTFSVASVRNKCNYEEANDLTEIIGTLSGEVIFYSPNDDGTYSVDNIWKAYTQCLLDTEASPDIIEGLQAKGLIYEEPEGQYNLVK